MATNTDGREEIKPVAPTEQTKWRDPSLVGKYMVDPKTGLAGLFRSPDNGETWVLTDTVYGHVYNQDEVDNIWDNGAGHKVADEIKSATADLPNVRKQADEAVKFAESAIAASKVNSDAIVAQSSAVVEAKSAMDSATAEIQQTAANAASDAAKIRADVAQVQSEVDTAKAANSASVEALKSDIGSAKKDLADVHDSLDKAQSAIEQNQKLINDSVAKISNDIAQDRKDLATAQQNNADLAKQLDDYSKQAEAQGKTIKSIQNDQNGFTATLADVKGNVSQVSDKVDGLSTSLKDTQGNVATVKAQADQLNATLTDHAKSIATLTASAKELSSTLEDADGRLNKVEQTAQTNSSTLSDVQGDLSQVKQQADGLVTTLKDAQGSITQIQQKADGTLAQLKSAQGDIASLQTDVTGIKATLVSHEGDIHTLQADSKSLHDSMQDAQGDISTLKKTSTDVTSELKDHAGRISKTEQTASTLVNEFADQQGHLNRVEQTANGTQQTVADQQGQINTIKTDTAGIHQTITGQDNQIANINVTLNGLNTKYDGVSGDLSKLSDKVTTNSTQIDQNKQAIALKADQSTVDNLSGEVSKNTAQLNVQADQISSKVSSEDFKTLDNKVGGAIAQIDKNTTAIDQTNKQISLKADQTEVNQVKQTATQNSSRLDVMAGQISSKVTSTDVNNIVDKKGYATTSTVQSLITQKAGTINESIVKLDQTVKQGAENNVQLVRKSEFEDGSKGSWNAQMIASATNPAPPAELGQSGMKVLQSNTRDAYEVDVWYSVKPGEKFDVDFWCAPSTVYNSKFGLVFVDKNKGNPNWLGIVTDHSGAWKHYTGTIAAPTNAAFARPWFQIDMPADHHNTSWLAKPSIRRQNATTVAAIQQITASIDGLQSTVANKADKSQITQLSNMIQSKVSASDFNDLKDKTMWKSADSIDLNNAVSQQNIFVKGGSNLPPGDYWWYVQVEPGYDSRIVQYAVSDRDNIHYSRQYDGSKWSAWSQGATESEITQLRDDINLRVKSGDLLSQINLTAHNTLIQSNKIYLDSSSTVFSGRAFIPSAAIASLSADKITTGTLSGVDIHQIKSEKGRSIDISNGNISLKSNDDSEARITFNYKGELTKMFNAVGDIEGDEFTLFNFKPNDTQSLYPQPYFAAINKNGRGSGDSDLHFDHSVINGHEWWSNTDGVTFGRTWDGVNGSSTYINIYAQSFAPHSQLSSKTRIEKLDGKEALESIMQDNMYTYQYKSDVADGKTKRYASLIIDDVHDVAQYTEPEMFLADNKKCRDDGTQLAYLIAAFQYQSKIIDSLQSKISKLEEKTNGYPNN